MPGVADGDDNPLGRWLDAERRLSPDPEFGDPAEAAGPEIEPADGVEARTARFFWGAVGRQRRPRGPASACWVGFRGDWEVGGGLVALPGAYRRYRAFRAGGDSDDA